jgi:predicted TIM-barrel fold metal-dependent hydrolase
MDTAFRIDSHAHVFLKDLGMAAGRRYTPHYDAGIDQYLAMLDANGMTHGVLVQPSFLGTDNRYLLAALAAHPDRLRGIAVADPAIGLSQIATWKEQGVVGLRLNLIGRPDPDPADRDWLRHLTCLAQLSWQLEVQVEADRLAAIAPAILKSGVTLVIDHFGRLDRRLGTADPGFHHLLSLGAHPQVWVKLSGAYRIGSHHARAAARALLRAFGPERLVWGSDWPHTQFEAEATPDRALAALDDWVPDATQRDRILGESAASLFGFSRTDRAGVAAPAAARR